MTILPKAIQRYAWIIRGAVLLAILVGACKEIPVDSNTANVIRRTRDTVVRHTIKVERDTAILIDTIVTTAHDTLYRPDTIIDTRTIIRIDSIFARDTVIQKDTAQIRDTTTHIDTVLVKGERVLIRDTVVRYDTTQPVSNELPRSGVLYRLRAGVAPLSVPVEIDEITRFVVEMQGGKIGAIQLKLMARVTEEYDTLTWDGVAPSWLYMIAGRVELTNGKGRRELGFDPWNMPAKAGIAIIPRFPYNTQWIATGRSGSGGEFVVTNVDTAGRLLYGYIKAHFDQRNAVIDSLALKFRY